MKKYSFILIIIVFFMLYYPPLFKINVLHIIGGISCIYIIINKKAISNRINMRKIAKIYLLFILLSIYLFIIAFVNGNSYKIVATYLYWMVDIISACIVVNNICLRKKYTETDFITLLLIVGNIQGVLSLLAFLNPEFQSLFIETMIAYGFEEKYRDLAYFRLYGVSSNLTFSTPIVQSMLAMVAVYLSIEENLKYMILVPLLIFSAVTNARSAFIIILIGLVMIFFYSCKFDMRKIPRIIIIITLSIVCFITMINVIKSGFVETYEWIDTGIKEIKLFLKGDATGYFTYVTDQDKYTMPSGLSFFFGKGTRVLGGSKYYFSSDVGWVNDIWTGGIIYSVIIYSFFCKKLHEIYRHESESVNLNKFLASFLFGILFVANFKGPIFESNEVITVIFLLWLFIINKPTISRRAI